MFLLLAVGIFLNSACGQGMMYFVDSPVDFFLPTLDGETVEATQFQGKVLLVQFWATWCPPCLQEIPHLNEIYREYRNEGLEILGIAIDRHGRKRLKPFFQEHPVVYPILLANDATMNISITGIPTTFVIDRDLKVVKKFVGYKEKQVFVEEIQKLF